MKNTMIPTNKAMESVITPEWLSSRYHGKCPLSSHPPLPVSNRGSMHIKVDMSYSVKKVPPKPVPKMSLIDMRESTYANHLSRSGTGIKETFANGGSAIVLFNRRGYAPVVRDAGTHTLALLVASTWYSIDVHKRSPVTIVPFTSSYCVRCRTPINIIGYGPNE